MTSVIWLLSTHFIIEPPREQPAHTEHVRGGAKGAVAETVFALAKFARAMVHRDFDETETGAFHQRGNETMHAFERQQRADTFASHRFQGAPGIAHAIPGETAPHKICDTAGDALHHRVLASRAITAHQIRAARDLGEERRNIGGIILQIAVDQDSHGATGVLQTRVDGGALPGVAFESEHANPRIARDPLRRPICRAVIDENYLVIDATERRGQLALEERHIFFLVKERHHHGHRGRTLAHSGSVRYFRQRNTCHSRIFVPNRVTSMVAIRSTDSKPARMLCGTTIPLPLWT